jgi:hypothetical protein
MHECSFTLRAAVSAISLSTITDKEQLLMILLLPSDRCSEFHTLSAEFCTSTSNYKKYMFSSLEYKVTLHVFQNSNNFNYKKPMGHLQVHGRGPFYCRKFWNFSSRCSFSLPRFLSHFPTSRYISNNSLLLLQHIHNALACMRPFLPLYWVNVNLSLCAPRGHRGNRGTASLIFKLGTG